MQDPPNARTLALAMQEEVAVSFLGLVIFVPSFHQSPSNLLDIPDKNTSA